MGSVWILGAGFSRPLGGPLLSELFSEAAGFLLEYRHKHPGGILKAEFFEERDGVVNAYKDLLNRKRIANAEEFLELLDKGVRREFGSDSRLKVELRGLPQAPELLLEHAKKVLAAECNEFVYDVDVTNDERALPYKRWLKQLTNQDAIVTFNYDTLIEEVAKFCNPLWVPVPLQADDPNDGKCSVFKLHGSVDWEFIESETVQVTRNKKPYDLVNQGKSIAIAHPGNSKMQLSRINFGRLWDQAKSVLRTADVIHIIGYSMPPSDAYGREFLLDAVRHSDAKRIEIVLGPGASDDKLRLMRMLERASSLECAVRDASVFGQEYLALYDGSSGS